jgi:CheY-like chemotaxis protein/anti-sigma regulatory factor (Ser/Thr protein kinase)
MLPEFATVSLGELLDQMRVEFTPSARAKGIDLRILTASVHVRSDRRMLRRILQNLISNAVKYTPSGRVLVGCRRRGGSIVLRVYDTGPGIPPDKQSIIFKEFERLPGLPAGVRGLGLGLSIVERMSRVLEQPVVLSSKPGRGTVFSLTLPRVNGMAPAATTPASRSEPEGLPIGDLVALCIDNDPAILEGMRALLTTWKVEVLTAASTEAALDKVRASSLRPDIVLADYHLDGDTGVDTIAAIRRELGRDIDAAIISADASPETLARIRSENLLLLRKPVRAAPLRALLAHASRMRAAAE